MRDVRAFEVEVSGWGHTSFITVSARSRAAARYAAWREISEPTQIDFKEFLNSWVCSVRLSRSTPTRYTYAEERYGVRAQAGDRVTVRGSKGVVAEPPGRNGRHNYIYVIEDGQSQAQPWHPIELKTPPAG